MKSCDKPIVSMKEKVDEIRLLKLLASNKLTKEQKDILYKYKNLIKEGYVTINYFYSKNLCKGRLYARGGASYQGFSKQIRHTLANDIYDDIDMTNAAPTILQQYCKKKNLECKMLTRYVMNREIWLSNIMKFHNIDRSSAKDLILRLMYLGGYKILTEDKNSYDEPEKKIREVVNFSSELKKLAETIYNLENDLKIIVEGIDEYENKKASLLSILSQILRRKT